jgi:UDPglucose--hexose-1-phosphate uridylyltransferase
MPELRHDPIQKRWVIIATERGRRPSDFLVHSEKPATSFCPFCAGNEDKTPPEIWAIRPNGTKPNTAGWEVRVVANKFPALMIEGDLDRRGVGIYDQMNGVGAHEVVIEGPAHDTDLSDQSVEHLAKVFRAYRERLADLEHDLRFRYVLIFKNYGLTAGASLSHPHTQLIATPITPRTVAIELDSAREHYAIKERCLFCDIINQELEQDKRVVSVEENYLVMTPFASRFPFELLVTPIEHHHDFGQLSDADLGHLAVVMKKTLLRLKRALNDPPYNFIIHTSPNMLARGRRPGHWQTLPYDYHWHIEIIPRLTRMAGFEWGTGFYINPTPPEDAARYLREIEAPV